MIPIHPDDTLYCPHNGIAVRLKFASLTQSAELKGSVKTE